MNIKKIVIGGAAATALGIAALAGTATAFASGTTPIAHAQSTSVQQGDQTTPDTAASSEKAGVEAASESDGPGGHADADGVDVQQGDQSAPDTAASAEKPGSETGVSDGPGGHADAPGNADHQFEGTE
ncbi:MAG: hypothetical protein HHJ11_15385 [Phycicoccus sp.]|nr:hypothetical protein [Phycicoccus sp.]